MGGGNYDRLMLRRHRESHKSGRTSWLRAAVLGSNDAIVSNPRPIGDSPVYFSMGAEFVNTLRDQSPDVPRQRI